ncbi:MULTISPECIES: flagellar hook-length control protein FliK [Helicobacter]|uniref:flagellar hook-length control protein FliK n=1 Tax=Helicobacter TaxID=209 RepID=UPI002628D67C|nr:flagellar hook-length control protein FliK [Helicobacter sp. UBA3407]
MLPLIDIEQVNQKSVIKTSNAQNVSESEGGGFAEIFNFLSMDKNSKKSETKSKKTSQNSLEIPQELNKFSKNSSQQSNILKSLDEKYNLSKKFVESQKTESRNKNVKINISNNTQDTLPTKTTLKSARDLLEFSKTQTQEVKTLKDLNKVAEDLKLNIQKINLQKDNTNQEIKFKGVPKQEMLLDKQILKTNTANPKVTQKESKESLNILSNLLQDKELLNKESSKDSKASPNKTDFKAENKESLNVKNSTQNLKKEEKNLKDSQNVENLTPTKEKIESKTDFKTKEAENLEAKNKLQKTEIKNAQEKEKVKAKNIKESPDKPAESLQAKAQEPSKEIPKQEVGKQDFVVKNEIKQEEKVKEKTNQEEMLKESQNTKVASQSKATQESLRNPFALKEQKEVKESFLKEEKEDKRNIKNSKTTTTQSLNTLGNAFKEENIKQDIKQQDIFLENLLKTTEKSAQSSKETSKEAMLEVSKENTEKKAKINQEIYQASTQAQVENRLGVQNTFLHFSDKLREALQNYRPPITRLSLELNPENLGSVELTITKRGENVSVQITSNQTALQLFMQNAQEFKNSLSNLGLNDVNLEFKDNAGNLLDNGDFNGSNGGNSGGFGGQNQGENPRKEQNLTQNSDENSQNTQKWNENSLHIYKEVNNPYAKVALVEINFSYYA